MVDIARYFLEFTQDQSCGKCTFCRIGTRRMLEILERITAGNGSSEDIKLLEDICDYVKNNSICGLGKSAPNPTLSTLRYFKDEYIVHVEGGKCPAGVCTALTTFVIVKEACKACGLCIKACPTAAITGEKKVAHVIEQKKCTKCGACREVCPFDAVGTK